MQQPNENTDYERDFANRATIVGEDKHMVYVH
jgi:hypothetical protein